MVERRIPNPMVVGSSPSSPATTRKIMNKLSLYIRHSKAELLKVIFPTKQQVKQSFIAVIIVVAFIATFLAVVDLIMSSILSAIL